MRRADSSAGFTVIELLISAAIGLLATAAVCTLLTSGQVLARTETERASMLQRLRVGSDVLSASIRAAGAGPDGGAAPGALSRRFAPILPRRIGRLRADSEDVFRDDAITTVSVATDAIPATLAFALPPGSSELYVDESFCGSGSACGISTGDTVAVFDSHGRFDFLSVLLVEGSRVQVRHCGGGLTAGYSRGTPVVAVDVATHYLDRAANQIRRYDGDASDAPSIDDV
ncbi:MAG: type II secretion system GspH family protein [Acidobacteria bacterium]|nr:type II secretion system GspH family protein [Acidobacteriota bacterium]